MANKFQTNYYYYGKRQINYTRKKKVQDCYQITFFDFFEAVHLFQQKQLRQKKNKTK